MRLGAIPTDRCHYGIKAGENLLTRCMFKRGHSGQHEGKGLKKFPYQRIVWFARDSREFITDKPHEFAWSERKQKKPSA